MPRGPRPCELRKRAEKDAGNGVEANATGKAVANGGAGMMASEPMTTYPRCVHAHTRWRAQVRAC